MATDNAASALGRIVAQHAEALGAADGGAAYVSVWLGALPLKADAVEATVGSGGTRAGAGGGKGRQIQGLVYVWGRGGG